MNVRRWFYKYNNWQVRKYIDRLWMDDIHPKRPTRAEVKAGIKMLKGRVQRNKESLIPNQAAEQER